MLKLDERFTTAVEAAVSRVEEHTDAEIVVVAAERSAPYRDAGLAAALIGAIATLCVVLLSNHDVAPVMVPLDVSLGALAVYGLSRWRPLLHALLGHPRRHRAALVAARDAFVTEAVHGTPQRSGVLIYVSALEGEVVVIPDVGVAGKVPQGRFAAAAQAVVATDLAALIAGLHTLGETLAEFVPPRPDDSRVELADAPRVRLGPGVDV